MTILFYFKSRPFEVGGGAADGGLWTPQTEHLAGIDWDAGKLKITKKKQKQQVQDEEDLLFFLLNDIDEFDD